MRDYEPGVTKDESKRLSAMKIQPLFIGMRCNFLDSSFFSFYISCQLAVYPWPVTSTNSKKKEVLVTGRLPQGTV